MDKLFQRFVQNMDEDAARNALSSLDDEQVAQAIDWAFKEMVIPHLEDIKERSKNDPDVIEVRQRFEDMDEPEREEFFYDTLDELVATLVVCRERPGEGFSELKTVLRDPVTQEALLLLFHNEEHIDEEYSRQLKDFTADHLHWVGCLVFPEMYEDDEVERVMDRFGIEPGGGEATPGGA